MRSIEDYSNEYNKLDFEEYEVIYRRKKILEIIQKNKPESILEVGCGNEPLFKFLSEYEKYVLVEPSSAFFENALKESEKFDGKDRRAFINNFIEKASETLEHNYDFIVCSSLLHEVEDPRILLRCLHSLCDDKTIVHINVPNANSFHRVLAIRMGIIQDVHEFSSRNTLFQQHSVFDMQSLMELVETSEFNIMEKGGYFLKPFTHAQMLSMIENSIIDRTTLDGLDLMYNDVPELCAEIYVNIKIK